jgi:hypothetical protein
MTPQQAIAACKQLRAELIGGLTELNACRRAARAVRKRAVEGFTASGIGRSIFGARAERGKSKSRNKALTVVIPGPRVVQQGTGLLVTAKLRGFAALVEKGGSTKPHEITGRRVGVMRRYSNPKQGPLMPFREGGGRRRAIVGTLTFMGRSGHLVSPKAVNHPGSRFPKDDFYGRAWPTLTVVLQAEIEKGYQKLAEKVR